MISVWGSLKRWDVTQQGLYSDNTPFVKVPWLEEAADMAEGITIKASSITELFSGLALATTINDMNFFARPIRTLVLPYIPGARQDRYNIKGDVLSSLSMVAELINSLKFDRVIVADPHSPAAYIYINNLVEYPLENIYERLWKGYTGVIAPDKGARMRAATAGNTLDLHLFQGGKVRDVSNGRLTGFEVEPLEAGGHYIVIDDICDGGGTFVGLGYKIAEQGAYADLFVTHGIFAKGTKDLKSYYKNIYTTDTHEFHSANEVMKFNVVEDMENYNG